MSLAEAEELGSREVEIESKKFLIEIKANDQGKFVKILEVGYTSVWEVVCLHSVLMCCPLFANKPVCSMSSRAGTCLPFVLCVVPLVGGRIK